MSSDSQVIPAAVRDALCRARADGKPLAVVLRLRGGAGQLVPMPETTRRLTIELLDRATATSQTKAVRHNIFPSLGTFVVEADADFLTALFQQPEIAHVTLNRRSDEPGDSILPPVQRSPDSAEKGWASKEKPPRPTREH